MDKLDLEELDLYNLGGGLGILICLEGPVKIVVFGALLTKSATIVLEIPAFPLRSSSFIIARSIKGSWISSIN